MSNYSVLKQDINNNIYENQTQQITGTVLNAILNEMTASLGAGYQFAGVATLGMNPGDPDQRVFYLAGEGIYTNFGGIQVPAGKLGVLKWDNRWTLQTIDGLGGGGANLTGYVSVASTDDLPEEGQPTLGYLCGTNLYLYVGEGGDTKEGKYQDCGSFRGPDGAYIQDIEQTETSHENGGRNTIKMTLSDGRSFNAYVHNGTTSSGLFPTVAALQAAYPNPVVGQYAFVGAGFPADIYVCTTAGTWTDSGEDYDGDNVDLTDYATKAEVNQLEAKVDGFVVGRTDYPSFTINKYYNTSGILATSNGWVASSIIKLIPGCTLKFGENLAGYYMRRIVVYDGDNHYLNTIYPNSTNRMSYPVSDIKTAYPTAEYVGIGLSDGTTTTEIAESITSDFSLYQYNADASIQKVVTELKEVEEGVAENSENIHTLEGRTTDLEDLLLEKENPFTFVLNKLVTSSGNLVDNNGWAMSDKMEIANNSTYIFGDDNTLGYYLYYAILYDASNNFLGHIAMSQESSLYRITGDRLKQAYPSAKYVLFDLWGGSAHAALSDSDIADWSLVESITGTIPAEIYRVEKEVGELKSKPNLFHCDLTPDAESYILSPFNDTFNLKTKFKIKRTGTLTVNPTFSFVGVSRVNKASGVETVLHNCPDDICPASYNGTYIGANHGCSDLREITATGHGKTAEDVGSVWTNGTVQCTLVGVPDENTLWFMGANYRAYPLFTFNTSMFSAGVTLTHISGATHTGSISIVSATMIQWRSALIGNVSVFVDDDEVLQSGDYQFDKLRICERYDVLNPASVIEKMREAVGTLDATPNPNTFVTADKVARHSIVYEFDSAAEWRMATDFLAYQDILLSYFGFTQQMVMEGTIKMYIPKALPINNGSEDIDFRTVVNYTSVPAIMNLTGEYWENPNLPPDRWLQFSQYLALHSGYLFDYGVGGSNRKDYINNAFFLNTTRKIYPHGIDSEITVHAGDNLSAVVWRSYLDVAKVNTGGIIAANVFEYAGDCYIYADFNAVGIYELDIPAKFTGRKIEVFEKRDNVELLTSLSNSKILVKVTTGTPMYGYLVAKING